MKKKTKPVEEVVLEVRADGSIKTMTAAKARAWRRSIKTKIRK